MQAIVKIKGRDCTQLHIWEHGLPGPSLFHHSFVFYLRGFVHVKRLWFVLSGCVFPAPPGGAVCPPSTQRPTQSCVTKSQSRSCPAVPADATCQQPLSSWPQSISMWAWHGAQVQAPLCEFPCLSAPSCSLAGCARFQTHSLLKLMTTNK